MHIAVTKSHGPPSRNRCRFSDGWSRVVKAVYNGLRIILKGSWDLVTKVINRVTLLIITYNPNKGTYNLTY